MIVLIRQRGGRFLKKDDDDTTEDVYWVEVADEKTIREKVSHAFRTQTKRSKNATGNRNNGGHDGGMSDVASSARNALSVVFSNLRDEAEEEDDIAHQSYEHGDLVQSFNRKKARMAY
mmetsp:Transcript_24935/g.38100  ORF Transcript_24935/g.38100 Transcript_24935/m.38100 type:complete len:118 (-) Transcript_24935:377-730(-)